MPRMILRQDGYADRIVPDFDQASIAYSARREGTGLGSSEFPEATLLQEEALPGDWREVARVSYNGRVWRPGPWHAGDVPLYDNRRPVDEEKRGEKLG